MRSRRIPLVHREAPVLMKQMAEKLRGCKTRKQISNYWRNWAFRYVPMEERVCTMSDPEKSPGVKTDGPSAGPIISAPVPIKRMATSIEPGFKISKELQPKPPATATTATVAARQVAHAPRGRTGRKPARSDRPTKTPAPRLPTRTNPKAAEQPEELDGPTAPAGLALPKPTEVSHCTCGTPTAVPSHGRDFRATVCPPPPPPPRSLSTPSA